MYCNVWVSQTRVGKEEREGDPFLFLVKLIELLVHLVGYLVAFDC